MMRSKAENVRHSIYIKHNIELSIHSLDQRFSLTAEQNSCNVNMSLKHIMQTDLNIFLFALLLNCGLGVKQTFISLIQTSL